MNDNKPTIKERLREIWRIWNQPAREVRQTAIGWQPDESYRLTGYTSDGTPEYSKIIRKVNKK